VFNVIGPLLNPALPQFMLTGVRTRWFCTVSAEIPHRLGRESAWVLHGHSMDEVSFIL
jgi:anthranilate phosphoribosyltransferase